MIDAENGGLRDANDGVSSAVGTILMVGLVVALVGAVTLTVVTLTEGRIDTADRALGRFEDILDSLGIVVLVVA